MWSLKEEHKGSFVDLCGSYHLPVLEGSKVPQEMDRSLDARDFDEDCSYIELMKTRYEGLAGDRLPVAIISGKFKREI